MASGLSASEVAAQMAVSWSAVSYAEETKTSSSDWPQ